MTIHFARSLPYGELREGLADEVARGNVSQRCAGSLSLFCYTRQCVYYRQWSPFSLVARGLILDEQKRATVATPFPKFFGVGERDEPIPALPFETFEKLDGSLIIVYFWNGEWHCATKGSFDSEQAKWAKGRLAHANLTELTPGTTYLCEAIYAANRIVVRYDVDELVLLAAYDEGGAELSYDKLREVGEKVGWRCAGRMHFDSVWSLVEHAKTLPASEEGFVLRFENSLRLKIKGDEYKRIHALVSECTPLGVWRALAAGQDLGELRRELPEEFWGDFDAIELALRQRSWDISAKLIALDERTASWSDKEVGLALRTFDEPERSLLFAHRKGEKARVHAKLMELIRPHGNKLANYTPSFAMKRVEEQES